MLVFVSVHKFHENTCSYLKRWENQQSIYTEFIQSWTVAKKNYHQGCASSYWLILVFIL